VTAVLKPGRNCWIIEKVFASGLLIDGRDYYKSFYTAAENLGSRGQALPFDLLRVTGFNPHIRRICEKTETDPQIPGVYHLRD
jgi:hypothetical protein